jgi:hypothetical protein
MIGKHTKDITPTKPALDRLSLCLAALAVIVVLFRLWTSFCVFPLADWNSIRLAPSFMLRSGQTPYPELDGALTTWIYGPVPLFIHLPATLATNTATALLIADGINIAWTIVPLALVVYATTKAQLRSRHVDRLWVFLLCLALWPNSSLQYIQADNAALALGLLSNLLLFRTHDKTSAHLFWAALCAALAVWSKQTTLGLVLAQLLWLNFSSGSKASIHYTLICVGFLFALGSIFVAQFGFNALWLNLVAVPARIPWCENFIDRTRALGMHIAGCVLLPATGLIIFRRTVWTKNSAWLLPALTWLCLLPTSIMSIYKIGGASNSLNGFLYLLVPSAVALIASLKRLAPAAAHGLMTAGIFAITTQQLAFAPAVPLRPLTQHLQEADFLAQKYPGQIYFPWNTLVTFFTDRRFYHAEDGIYTRHVAQFGTGAETLLRNLPARWSMTAILRWRNADVFKQLQPSTGPTLLFGNWTLYPTAPLGRQPQANGSGTNASNHQNAATP